MDTICDLLEFTTKGATIYCNTPGKVLWLTEALQSHDFAVSALHQDMEWNERKLRMRELGNGSTQDEVLITTDLGSRGIAVEQFPLVVNYDFPHERETYISRICGSGVVINFITGDDVRQMRDIEQFLDIQIEEMPMDIADLI